MSKRSTGKFERKPHDYYATPIEGVLSLLPHLGHRTRFVEPCVGGGHLASHLTRAGHECVGTYDVESSIPGIPVADARTHRYEGIDAGTMFITNPPWSRDLLHPMITNLSDQAPTWLLFDSDWLYTKQARPFYSRTVAHVSAGRIEWFKGDPSSSGTGYDNCSWYLFDAPNIRRPMEFWR